ncbi:MAG: PAS domain S-box protein [Anaerolineae bacterium]|nr:PAS domain S-box protein [Anaerolineae bacterium]
MQRNEMSYRMLFVSHPTPMWIYDPESMHILDVNEAAIKLYGYSHEDFLKLNPRDLRPAEDASTPVSETRQPEEPQATNEATEWIHLRQDGTPINVEIVAHAVEFEYHKARLVMATDITLQRRAEERLRLDRQILQQLPVAIIITDLDRQILYWMAASEFVLGFSAEEMLGSQIDALQSPDFDFEIYRAMWRQLAKNGRVVNSVLVRTKAGEDLSLLTTVSYLRDDQGVPEKIIWVMRDAEERLDMEEERLLTRLLESELTDAIRMSDLRDQLVSMVAHEFKSPLTAIKLYRDIIAKQGHATDKPRVRDALNRIDTQITTLIDLVDDLITLNQASLGKLVPVITAFDLADLCCRVSDHWTGIIGDRHPIVCEVPDNKQIIEGDMRLIKRVLDNLMSNAVKYSPVGGRVTLILHWEDADAVIHVKDEGIGIPEAAKARVFEMFERAENALHLSGTGVGLAYCRMVIDLHHGTINFNSVPDRGTTFVVRLPLKQPGYTSVDSEFMDED